MWAFPLCAAIAMAGCAFGGVGGALAEPPAGMPAPTGPMIEIGRGQSLGIGWRYLVYESAEGTCTVVEQDGGGGGGCGGEVGPGPGSSAIGLMSMGSGTGSPTTVEGFATDEVAEVWIERADGERVRAELMSLAPAGKEGAIFLAFVPEGRLRQVVALSATGETIASEPLDNP